MFQTKQSKNWKNHKEKINKPIVIVRVANTSFSKIDRLNIIQKEHRGTDKYYQPSWCNWHI